MRYFNIGISRRRPAPGLVEIFGKIGSNTISIGDWTKTNSLTKYDAILPYRDHLDEQLDFLSNRHKHNDPHIEITKEEFDIIEQLIENCPKMIPTIINEPIISTSGYIQNVKINLYDLRNGKYNIIPHTSGFGGFESILGRSLFVAESNQLTKEEYQLLSLILQPFAFGD